MNALKVDYENPEDMKWALIQAADGHLDWVQDLLDHGTDPNGMPLIMAIQCNEPEIVQLMIGAGADVNQDLKDGRWFQKDLMNL